MAPAKKKADFTVRTSQFVTNPLMKRRQFTVELTHPHWCGTVPGKLVKAKLASMYKVAEDVVSIFGFKTHFGGGKTTGYGLIYEDLAALKRLEPEYRKARLGMGKKKLPARKSLKERRNRDKKFRGTKKGKQVAKK
eukprot:Tbor_TRINITY_DN5523_c0_g3::TRINITY_DN5523_c0_g3_i1::g.12800::m.12800/K02974/RP-S24e, RPS24; small subunit ribosomal protein S24e